MFPDKPQGFTLIEVVVALVLLGLISGLALPNLTKLYERLEYSGQIETFVQRVDSLGIEASQRSLAFLLRSRDGQLIGPAAKMIGPVPGDWRIEVAEPVRYFRNGACSGGSLRVLSEDREILGLRLSAPHCRVRDG